MGDKLGLLKVTSDGFKVATAILVGFRVGVAVVGTNVGPNGCIEGVTVGRVGSNDGITLGSALGLELGV